MEKKLGKISSVDFGIGGYQDCMIGIRIGFTSGSAGVFTAKEWWDPNKIECTDSSKWTEEDRSKELAETMRFISDILHKSKVSKLSDLVGVPVEITFDKLKLVDWRILEEVL